ncbi:MAG: DUF1501 domain-containing protein, partial [Burkholderiaceae bacterium]
MKRRDLLKISLASSSLTWLTPSVFAAAPTKKRLVLIELKGGNDGLNTLVPYADTKYYELRPRIAIARDQVVQLTEATGLHPALTALKPMWDSKELAVLQGVGYPSPNLSHFRSIEIWDTASRADETLQQGWLTRSLPKVPSSDEFAADGVLIGNSELGPFVGGARAVTLGNPAQFANQARLAQDNHRVLPGALGHVAKVESDIVHAAARLAAPVQLKTVFPNGGFGNAVRAGAQVLASGAVPVVRLTLNGFDTHQNQLGAHAALLTQLGEGMVALRSAMQELNLWNDTLILTYSEFGRRPRENGSAGTDHGTASVHFALGGRVSGGMFGAAPSLAQLDGTGNVAHAIDFRSVYASVLKDFLGLDARLA